MATGNNFNVLYPGSECGGGGSTHFGRRQQQTFPASRGWGEAGPDRLLARVPKPRLVQTLPKRTKDCTKPYQSHPSALYQNQCLVLWYIFATVCYTLVHCTKRTKLYQIGTLWYSVPKCTKDPLLLYQSFFPPHSHIPPPLAAPVRQLRSKGWLPR